MPVIRESIVVTTLPDGRPHLAPLGVIEELPALVLAPFHPSTTLANLERDGRATVCYVADATIFAGLVTGRRRDWPVVPLAGGGWRLAAALAHDELEVVQRTPDPVRPRFTCRVVASGVHAAFQGLNRARAALVEAAILVTRLHLLPPGKVQAELDYLAVAIAKTAGPAELEAWGWLTEAVAAHASAAQASAADDKTLTTP